MKLEVVKKFMKGNENQKGSHFLRKNQMHSHARHAHHREKKASLSALEIIKSAGCHLIRSLKLSSSSEMDPESE